MTKTATMPLPKTPSLKNITPKKLSPPAKATVAALLNETRVFKPAKAFKAKAHLKDTKIYAKAARNPSAWT